MLHFLLSLHSQDAQYECGDSSPPKWEGDRTSIRADMDVIEGWTQLLVTLQLVENPPLK